MDHHLEAVAQGVPSFPCLLPFIMGCLVKNARAAPAALPQDTVHLPLVARLLINTEDDGPLAGVPTQHDASSDAQVNPIQPSSIETAAQSEPTFTIEERPGSGRSLPTPTVERLGSGAVLPTPMVVERLGSGRSLPTLSVDERPGSGRVLPTPTADDGPGTAKVVAILSRGDSSGQVLPTDIATVQDDLAPIDARDQTGPDFPVDDGPGTALVVATLTRDETTARSLPTEAASVQDDSDLVDAEGETEPDSAVDDGAGSERVAGTLAKDGTTARSLPTDVPVPEGEESPPQSDSEDTVPNGDAKLRARGSGMTLSSVYLLLG